VTCEHKNTSCINSRARADHRYRRYECKDCGERYSTIEVIIKNANKGVGTSRTALDIMIDELGVSDRMLGRDIDKKLRAAKAIINALDLGESK